MTATEVIALATHISTTGDTVRQTARKFNVSKSTIHKNVTEDLKYIDPMLYSEVRKVLDKNKAERHIRGGTATREKHLKRKKEGN